MLRHEYKINYEKEFRFVCNKCGVASTEKPKYKNETCPDCGSGRRKVEIKCMECGNWFNSDRYSKNYCSYDCKKKAQTTGRKIFRMTTTKARAAHSLLSYRVNKGDIKRPTTCEQCGKDNQRIEGAHFDYNEPLKVRWLCRSCHVKWDKQNPKKATYVV